MGRNNKKYRKDLHQQLYDKFNKMIAFGESKREAKQNGTIKNKIFSYSTYKTYYRHAKAFVDWIQKEKPQVKTIKAAKNHVTEYLQSRADYVDENGKHLSAWTIQTEAASLSKLYQIGNSPDRFIPPKRRREDIVRSRIKVKRDRHFSVTNNAELVSFCKGTGCRRNVLQKLEGRDLWSEEQVIDSVKKLEEKMRAQKLSEREQRHLQAMRDALEYFPNEDYYLHHRKDKGGRYRFSPIIGPDRMLIINRMLAKKPHEKVWMNVSTCADIHSYRAEYATSLYRDKARDISEIPYDKYNAGSGKKYQGDIYHCRNDEYGKKLDKRAMKICSKALGHNRVSIIASSYLRGL